ncbi:uncharacterized protein N7458_008780 [Penicillium daleae]|uniref:Uncharacterized protein n=1 Tax=Penicillium daleae TaxID=63821 RepID=A0AAD6BXE2_9EURO|nr:uncharacterized protein N7458_008780 [Penicillium daleae]KAJ5437782.1 hypothetical protein N7458_008780 [Penicillium daleae]
MLFYIKGFKKRSLNRPVLDCPENLYRLRVLDSLGQQQLVLKEEIKDKFVFCQVARDIAGYRIILEKPITSSMIRSRIRRAREITSIEQIARPYLVRYTRAKVFNKSEEVTDALQNVILQYSDIRTFVRHYKVDVDIDVQGIIRNTGSQTALIRFACSLSTSINPDRPYKLSPQESRLITELPEVRAKQDKVDERKRKRVRENLEHYKNKQPVIDLERQLQGKLVDTKVLGALENAAPSSPEFIRVIDTILTIPGTTVEAEYQRRINTINAVTAFYSVEEGRPTQRPAQSRRRQAVDDLDYCPSSKQRKNLTQDDKQSILQNTIESVRIKSPEVRPTICFLCVGNPNLPLEKRVAKHTIPGSLTRHFLRKHVNTAWPTEGVLCNICDNQPLEHKSILVNYAEIAYGTVMRGRAQEKLTEELSNTAPKRGFQDN